MEKKIDLRINKTSNERIDALKEDNVKKHIKPLFDKLVVSCDEIVHNSTILLPEGVQGQIDDTQRVLVAGPFSKEAGIEEGDKVVIEPKNFLKKVVVDSIKHDLGKVKEQYQVELPIEEYKGVKFLLISNRDIKYVIKK